MTTRKNAEEITPRPAQLPASARFVGEIEKQFVSEMGSDLAFSEYEKTLAQHLYVKVTSSLKAMEEHRLKRGQTNRAEFTWQNVNRSKLAIDSVHRIALGLDALIDNHIHVIAYWNSKVEAYDLDLRVGYVGVDFYRRRLAVEPPLNVIYELVYETDMFAAHPRSRDNEIESYSFEISRPFDRGPVIGGFGYIVHEDARKNRLVLVTPRDFARSKAAAQTSDFWSKNDLEMMYKTIVHRVASRIPLDPAKVNAIQSHAYVDAQESAGDFEQEIATNANRELVDLPDDADVVDAEFSHDEPMPDEIDEQPVDEDEPGF